jgi:purine-nucleoside phosphorylase
VAYIRSKCNRVPRVGLLTGTGLGGITEGVETAQIIETKTIPHFPVSTVESHSGRLVLGSINGVDAVIMQGRVHLYEGYCPEQVVFPIRLMRALGVEVVILTNAAGGLNLDFHTGDIMVAVDHINLTGRNPLVGPNDERWGPRFPDMVGAYDPKLADLAGSEGGRLGIPLQRGVYVGLMGPSLETPAESRFLKLIGADAVGFSTVLEVITAVHAGMRVLALSTITNINDPDHPRPATLSEIIASANAAAPQVQALIGAVITKIFNPDLCI